MPPPATTLSDVCVRDFTIAAGDDLAVTYDLNLDGDTIDGAVVFWNAYQMSQGVPLPNVASLISKSSEEPDQIIIIDSPKSFQVLLVRPDTLNLSPGNYYTEATVIDASGNFITVGTGLMTVDGTLNRPPH
jgi:hypothetical protein